MNSGVRLQLLFSKVFEGVVWGTSLVTERHLLIVEVRKPDVFETNLAAWDYHSRKWLWTDFRPDEPWWVSPVGSARGILLLQTYKHGANPDIKGLIAVDAETRRLCWRIDNFAFHDVKGAYVLGYSIEKDMEPASVDVFTGKSGPGFPDVPEEEPVESILLTPRTYPEQSPHFNTCRDFILRHSQQAPVGTIEYLEFGSKICLGYYVKEEESLANYLMVIDQDGGVALHERIGEGLGRETFFIVQGCLIFVKNKSELLSFAIT